MYPDEYWYTYSKEIKLLLALNVITYFEKIVSILTCRYYVLFGKMARRDVISAFGSRCYHSSGNCVSLRISGFWFPRTMHIHLPPCIARILNSASPITIDHSSHTLSPLSRSLSKIYPLFSDVSQFDHLDILRLALYTTQFSHLAPIYIIN